MSDMQPQGVFKSPADLEIFHETTDLDLKGVVVFTIALIAMCAAAFVGLKIMMDQFVAEEKAEKGADALPADRRYADRRAPASGRSGPGTDRDHRARPGPAQFVRLDRLESRQGPHSDRPRHGHPGEVGAAPARQGRHVPPPPGLVEDRRG